MKSTKLKQKMNKDIIYSAINILSLFLFGIVIIKYILGEDIKRIVFYSFISIFLLLFNIFLISRENNKK